MEPTRSNDWRLVTVRVLYSFLLLLEDSFERRKQFQKVLSPFPCADRVGRGEKIEGKKGKEEKRKEKKIEGRSEREEKETRKTEKKSKRGQKTGSIILCFF